MSNKSTKAIGQKLKKARKESGLSQKDLAKSLNVSDKTISAYEVGRAKPNFEMMKKISKLTKKPITYFDTEANADDVDLQTKLDTIERELIAVRELLKKQAK